ncbi:unnamed protein product [Cladocopium goreaui]|uniref:Uncharacterized protein n=1 Tax=Cladocopium goreaui TaxID=2562237 RepID=A0A9P1BFP8_9DINO|nr:unnamed protein product [Cladocopium goreaui]
MALPTKEDQHALCQLILLNGFQTDPNRPGVEKLVGCAVQSQWLYTPASKITSADLSEPTLASPGKLFLVKGWNRCLCALGILYCCYDTGLLLQEGTVYATVVKSDSNLVVNTNRGDQAASKLSSEAHESVSAFAQACSLGEKESAAAVNLLKHIPTNIKEALTELVRFELRHADSDILQMLETSVPPADVERVSIFLQPLKKYQSEVEKQTNLRAEQLLVRTGRIMDPSNFDR